MKAILMMSLTIVLVPKTNAQTRCECEYDDWVDNDVQGRKTESRRADRNGRECFERCPDRQQSALESLPGKQDRNADKKCGNWRQYAYHFVDWLAALTAPSRPPGPAQSLSIIG